MIIQNQVKRFWWSMLLVGFALDVAIAFAVAWLIAPEDERLITAGIIWLIIQALAVALVIRHVIQATVIWKLGQKQIVEDGFLAELRTARLPAPDEYENSVEAYLNTVAGNGEVPVETRLAAANLAGRKTMLNTSLGMVRGVMFSLAHERALARYKEQMIN